MTTLNTYAIHISSSEPDNIAFVEAESFGIDKENGNLVFAADGELVGIFKDWSGGVKISVETTDGE